MLVTTNTSRFRFQTYIESRLGCADLQQWGSFKDRLEKYTLSHLEAVEADACLSEDAADIYYKACLSLCTALNSLYRGLESWPVVNLYYSSFYSLRAHLAVLKVGIVRNRGIFRWEVAEGTSPVRVRSKGQLSDHKAILQAFTTIVQDDVDVLQSNQVAEQSVYDWLFEQRNQIQYRDRTFQEPEESGYFHPSILSHTKFDSQVANYILDPVPVYCFDPDHLLLAAPIRRLLDLKRAFLRAGLPNPLLDREESVTRLIDEIAESPRSELYRLLNYHLDT